MTVFDDFCMHLETVFTAAPQTETELNKKSATLALSGLFQVYSRVPLYASFRDRVKSYPKPDPGQPQRNVLADSVASFASSGFYYNGIGDETICPSCGLGLHDWQDDDMPDVTHMTFARPLDQSPPSLPCLYITTHRLLTSELPLARKGVVPCGPNNKSVCSFQGLISRPDHVTAPPPSTVVRRREARQPLPVSNELPSLSDRLQAIANAFHAAEPTAPSTVKHFGWPINNARSLGHSDGVIALAIWRSQAESVDSPSRFPTMTSLYIQPQATTDLLRVILRIQESFNPPPSITRPPPPIVSGLTAFSSSSDEDLPSSIGAASPEDAETAALVIDRGGDTLARRSVSPVSEDGDDPEWDKKVDLPNLIDYIRWWSDKYSPASYDNFPL